jgi:arginase family enzyme
MDELMSFLTPTTIKGIHFTSNNRMLQQQVVPLDSTNLKHLKSNDIVVLGVNESRNSPNPTTNNSPQSIRKYLYGLSTIKLAGKIYDAGDMVETDTPSKTYEALRQVVEIFFKTGAATVVLGGTQELTYYLYEGVKPNKSLATISIIDCLIDSDNDSSDFHSRNFINRMLDEKLRSLFEISIIGYQGYYVGGDLVNLFQNKNHELIRLGFVRSNYREVEPTLRNSDIVSFDMEAVRACDSPANAIPSPNGLYAEEACQLARYAGAGERANLFGIFNYNPDSDPTKQSAMLAAQLAWHFMEGYSKRKTIPKNLSTTDYLKFIVGTGTAGVDMVFYCDEALDRWWMEIPISPEMRLPNNRIIIPCSHNDYTLASRQEFPDRWLRILQKIQQL